MGKLTWTAMMLATLGLAGCKCCQKGSSCSNGSRSAPTTHSTSSSQPSSPSTTTSYPSLPTATSYPSMPANTNYLNNPPGSNNKAIHTPPSGWNNGSRPVGTPVSMPPMSVPTAPGETRSSQPSHHIPGGYKVMPVGAVDSTESADESTETPPSPAPVRTTTPLSVPSMTEQLPPHMTVPHRPRNLLD